MRHSEQRKPDQSLFCRGSQRTMLFYARGAYVYAVPAAVPRASCAAPTQKMLFYA